MPSCKQCRYVETKEGYHPRQEHGIYTYRNRPPPFPGLVLYGHECRYAREIQEYEYHESDRGWKAYRAGQCRLELGIVLGGRSIGSVHDTQGTYHEFLGDDTRQQADIHLPAESERLHRRRNRLAELTYVGMLLLVSIPFVGAREITQADPIRMVVAIFSRYCLPFSHVWRQTAFPVGTR